jgi:hypothetical protein
LSDEDRHLRGNAAFVFAALGDVWGTASFESPGASDSKDVQLGREHNDICDRSRSEIDKARKEYDRRFRAIQDHPVDYFHRWMVEILAGGNIEALGEYPYPSPALRH